MITKNNKLKMYMLIDRKNNKTKIILAKNMLVIVLSEKYII